MKECRFTNLGCRWPKMIVEGGREGIREFEARWNREREGERTKQIPLTHPGRVSNSGSPDVGLEGRGERESQRGFLGSGRTEETNVGILVVHADAHLDGRDGVLGLLQASEDVGNDRLDR